MSTYTQGYDNATLRCHQSRSASEQADYLLPRITPTSHILDVGCGPGTITCDFAALAPHGSVVGVDFGEQAITQAQHLAETRGLKNIRFLTRNAHHLPFPDDHFDIVHCHALLVHMPNPILALKEMRRVCRPSGLVAAREPDMETCAMHPLDPILQRWSEVQAALKRKEGAEPAAGRRLGEWSLAAGFEVGRVRVTSNVLQYFGAEEVKWWGELGAERAKTEVGRRAVEEGMVTEGELEEVRRAFLAWSATPGAFWGMMHMRLLCWK